MTKGRSDLLHGTLDLIILQLLRGEASNGWELTLRIQAVSRDVLNVNAGSLYPALKRLETRGWIRTEWRTTENNRRAKYYSLTPVGRKQLAAERDAWERYTRTIGVILRTG